MTLLNTVIFNILDIQVAGSLPFNVNENSYDYNICDKFSPSGICLVTFNNKYIDDFFEQDTKQKEDQQKEEIIFYPEYDTHSYEVENDVDNTYPEYDTPSYEVGY